MVAIKEGRMAFKGFETYYRITHPEGKKAPLLLLHGGPGSTHNYFEGFDKLAEDLDRPIIMYDQIGCGESATPGHTELYNAEVWMDELESLREHLGLKKVHILGQSWGGMLAISYMMEREPKGVLFLDFGLHPPLRRPVARRAVAQNRPLHDEKRAGDI